MLHIAVLASHNGSDLQAIMDACKTQAIDAKVCCVISNNSGSGALERARGAGIPAYHLSLRTQGDAAALDRCIRDTLERHSADIVFLAGYLKKLGTLTLEAYRGKIYNIHPALLPKYGGQGMYGAHVHAAVIAAGERETGITVHHVDAEYDTGAYFAQTTVPVLPGDTPEVLAARVFVREHSFLVEVLQKIIADFGGIDRM